MKTPAKIFGMFCGAMLLCRYEAHAQGFVNLNFEEAVIVPDPSDGSPAVYAAEAIPGWTATGFLGPTDVLYNGASLGSPSVSILGTGGTPPSLDGNYSVLLYGGVGTVSASISQTAVVPVSSNSIMFKGQFGGASGGTLLVSIGSQNIPFSALSTVANYTEYGANLPPGLAGQSETLMFTASPGENFWNIDDIQFSPNPVPEPATWTLLLCGAGWLGVMRYRRNR